MKIIGITGPSGTGKSLCGKILSENGIPTIDADEVYHSLLIPPSECLDAIEHAFGEEVFYSDGSLNRTALGAIVFNDENKLDLLNRTVLNYVVAEIRRIISDLQGQNYNVVALDAPTLIESGFYRECTTVISILAPRSERISRIMERDKLTESMAIQRIDAQKSDDFYRRHSDIVLFNDQTPDNFIKSVQKLLNTPEFRSEDFDE